MRLFNTVYIAFVLFAFSSSLFAGVKVAIVTTPAIQEAADELEDQLLDSTVFEFRVKQISPDEIQNSGNLIGFHSVVIGDVGVDSELYSLAFAKAIRDFFLAGGGIAAFGYSASTIGTLDQEIQDTLLEILPLNEAVGTFLPFRLPPATADVEHPVIEGIDTFLTSSFNLEWIGGGIKEDAVGLMNLFGNFLFAASWESSGRSIFVGNPYLAREGSRTTQMSGGDEDLVAERAVAWVAGTGVFGAAHTCMNTADSLKCWGSNSAGQLGLGSLETYGDETGETPASLDGVDLGAGFDVASVYVASDRNCALSVSGEIKCWGSNALGRLGLADVESMGDLPGTMGDMLPVVDLGQNALAEKLALGPAHACALLGSGELKCWGDNSYAQLGLGYVSTSIGGESGQMGDSLRPVLLPAGLGVEQIAVGLGHSCALLSDNKIYCWGDNQVGQLGIGSTQVIGDMRSEMGSALRAVDLGTTASVMKLIAGGDSTCALLNDRRAKCWGYNSAGQLGLGDTENRGDSAGEMGTNLGYVNLGSGQYIDDMQCSRAHCCAVTVQGTMKCWGSNKYGQLGYGDTQDRGIGADSIGDALDFVPFSGVTRISSFQVYSGHTCAESDDGWRCWGDNSDGQLGYGDTTLRGDYFDTTPESLMPIDL